jgi:DNA-binding MarR family transcriptional regulator
VTPTKDQQALGAGSTLEQIIVLLYVGLNQEQKGGVSQQEISDGLALAKSTVSRTLERLGAQRRSRATGLVGTGPDLVRQEIDPVNRRNRLITLTDGGKALVAAYLACVESQ